jgi:SlyX protein
LATDDTQALLHAYGERLAELETRLAFQEQAIVELSDALAEARMETARSDERLQRALADLKHSVQYADPGSEPPPPHY